MSVVITRDDIIAYAEVNYIIHHMNERYIRKLPEMLVRFFEEIRDPEHEIYIDPYKPLQSQGLRKYTLEIIALLHLKYWCEDEARKQQLYDLMLSNQRKIEEQMKEKFSIDNLFSNNTIKMFEDESNLLEQDFSKPRKIQTVQMENTLVENKEEIQNEKLLREIEQENEAQNLFTKIKRYILHFFHLKSE